MQKMAIKMFFFEINNPKFKLHDAQELLLTFKGKFISVQYAVRIILA